MSFVATPILTAIKEVMLGQLGSIRTVLASTFEYGKHSGLSDDELARKALVKPMFDVELLEARRAESTTGLLSNFSIYEIDIRVAIAYYLSSEALDDSRETARATALSDADVVMQALTFPGNLAQTSAAVATKLVGGLIQNQNGGARIEREDPDNNLLIVTMDFIGRVNVTQAV